MNTWVLRKVNAVSCLVQRCCNDMGVHSLCMFLMFCSLCAPCVVYLPEMGLQLKNLVAQKIMVKYLQIRGGDSAP